MRSGVVLGNHSESVSNKLGRSWLREILLAATDIGVGRGCLGRGKSLECSFVMKISGQEC